MINNEAIKQYVEALTGQQPDLLSQLEKETFQKMTLPQMISGAYQGRILSMISKLVNPKNILEIGTFTGFATLCLAEGLAKNGIIHTIDKNEEFQTIQNKYFKQSEYHQQIKQYLGNAMQIIPKIDEKFDLVFIDADKRHYPEYFKMILNKMNKGGLILADNILWYGKVTNDTANDAETIAIKKYNQLLHNDDRVEVVILPVRDGISIARVK